MFTIQPDNDITYHENTPDVSLYPTGTVLVVTKEHLEAYCNGMSRDLCQALYSSLPGAPAVKRLRNRPYAIERIWAVMQTLVPFEKKLEQFGERFEAAAHTRDEQPDLATPVAETYGGQTRDNVEMPKKQPRKRASKPATAPEAPKPPRKATAPANGHREPPKEGTRQATVIAMLNRKKGLTVAELVSKFDWKPWTCRGLLSTINANGWATVTSERNKAGERVYRAG